MGKKTNEEFLEELKIKNPMVLPLESYVNSKTKLLCRCLQCGNEWYVTPSYLLRGTLCKECGIKKRASSKHNNYIQKSKSIKVTHPELAKQWYQEKNGVLTPDDVTAGSDVKVWWICKKGHSWPAIIQSRTRTNRADCPFCNNRKVLAGFNDLATTNPSLAMEWNYEKNEGLLPSDLTAGSSKCVWWKCIKKHEWPARVYSRVKEPNCPFCINKRILSGYNDLATLRPDIASEWDYEKNGELMPKNVGVGSDKLVWWICHEGHSWQALIYNRTKTNGTNCPVCCNQMVLTGYNDLASVRPDLLSEWNYEKNKGISPDNVTVGSGMKVWWKCRKGHEWKASISARNRGAGCKICYSERQTSFPEQAILYYYSNSHKALSRYSENKFEIDIYIPSISAGIEYDGYFYHNPEAARKRETQKNDYYKSKGVRIIRIKESDKNYIEDDVIYYRFDDLYLELSWAIAQSYELLGIENIPHIDIKRDRQLIFQQYLSLEKENSIGKKYPQLLEDWDYTKNTIDPYVLSYSSMKPVFWKCHICGYSWESTPNNRTNQSGRTSLKGCRECAKKKRAISGNATKLRRQGSLQSHNPTLAKEWHPTKNGDLTPDDIMKSSGKKYWWLCKQGHEWIDSVSHRNNGCGCPYCSGKRHLRILCVETGEIFQKYSDAAEYCGLKVGDNISACCKGKKKLAGGYHWKYINDD